MRRTIAGEPNRFLRFPARRISATQLVLELQPDHRRLSCDSFTSPRKGWMWTGLAARRCLIVAPSRWSPGRFRKREARSFGDNDALAIWL